VIVASGNVYGDGIRTGLTWGDLRRLAAARGDSAALGGPFVTGRDWRACIGCGLALLGGALLLVDLWTRWRTP
jgi:hypothetical protein